MLTEPKEITDARLLLKKFENSMDQPEALVHLSGALSLLDEILANSEFENMMQIASTILSTYAKKVQVRVEPMLLPNEPPMSHEMVDHWIKVFEEFRSYDFELSGDIEETYGNILANHIKKDVLKFMSPVEKKQYIEDLLKG